MKPISLFKGCLVGIGNRKKNNEGTTGQMQKEYSVLKQSGSHGEVYCVAGSADASIVRYEGGTIVAYMCHIRQEGESCSVLYKTDIPEKHKKCSIKTGIGVRISSELVFEVKRNLHIFLIGYEV